MIYSDFSTVLNSCVYSFVLNSDKLDESELNTLNSPVHGQVDEFEIYFLIAETSRKDRVLCV